MAINRATHPARGSGCVARLDLFFGPSQLRNKPL